MPPTVSKIDAILARFPGPATLYPSRKKWLLILLGSALFTAAGIGMVAESAPNGWYGVIFFGACLIVSAIMMFPGTGGLVLDRDGFQVTNLFRSYRLRWREVTGFAPISIPYSGKRMLGFDIVAAASLPIAAMTAAATGRMGGLPDTYGFSVDELAQLMTRWQERAVTD